MRAGSVIAGLAPDVGAGAIPQSRLRRARSLYTRVLAPSVGIADSSPKGGASPLPALRATSP